MAVMLELEPDVEAAARAGAEAQGVPLETYLQGLVRGSVPLPDALQSEDRAELIRSMGVPGAGVMSDAEWDRVLRAGTFRSNDPLSDEALSRESLYEERTRHSPVSVTLELKPEVEAAARAGANATGVSLEGYLQTYLERNMPARRIPTQQEMAEFEADLDALAEGSERLPVLPPEANKRAYYYEE